MKKWEFLIFLLVTFVPAWGAGDQFSFISALSAPVASFSAIETKVTQQKTTLLGEFNIGSEASESGSIVLNGSKMQVGNLWMEDGTKIKNPSTTPIHWVVDTLQIGGTTTAPYAAVTVRKLLANRVSLQNTNQSTTLRGTNGADDTTSNLQLKIDESTWTQKGAAERLTLNGTNSPRFVFTPGEEPEKTATARLLSGHYPICTE